MPTTLEDFYDEYGRALRNGTASLFVGAGISQGAGYPGWDSLLQNLRRKANVPKIITDAPLVADYIEHELGRDKMLDGLLTALDVSGKPTTTHHLIHDLGVRHIWTTNYDQLLEMSTKDRYLVLNDSSYAKGPIAPRRTRIIKLHGSIDHDENDTLTWRSPPVITRATYETYASDHPLLWADLTARFLTSTFLFLGFSFNDPNIELLLRLGRGLSAQIRRSPHFAVFKRSLVNNDLGRADELRIRDLERSGISVVLIDSFDEVDTLLTELRRRTLPPNLFVSGAHLDPLSADFVRNLGENMARASTTWNLVSLGSQPALLMAHGMKDVMKEDDNYDPERAKFYYRSAPEDGRDRVPVPLPAQRLGTAIYTEQPIEVMQRQILMRSRAVLAVGGGERTTTEIEIARARGLPVIPLPIAGGTAGADFEAALGQSESQYTGADIINDLAFEMTQELTGHAVNPSELIAQFVLSHLDA